MKTDKKSGILYDQWAVPSAHCVFLLVHGLGAHTGRWEFLAEFFKAKSIASYAIELRGFGRTEGLKGHVNSLKTYFNDIRTLRGIIQQDYPEAKVFLVGESMGALIAFLLAGAEPAFFNGLICLSPFFKGVLKIAPLLYVNMLFSALFNPRKQFTIPFNARMCTRDNAYQKIMEEDTREHWLASARLLLNILRAQQQVKFIKDDIKIATLFLLAGSDLLVDAKASEKVFNSLKVADKIIITYPDMYHAVSIDRGRENVFEDILNWTQKRV